MYLLADDSVDPMFPGRIKQNPRILLLTLLITFISGASFFSTLMFWPTQAFNVYGHDPVQVGLRTFVGGIAIMVGACITLVLLSVFRGKNRELMIFSAIIMTAGNASLACATRYNLNTLWGLLILSGLGVGGLVVPASIITTIICPDDLIATVSALTLSIRVIGGSIGYCGKSITKTPPPSPSFHPIDLSMTCADRRPSSLLQCVRLKVRAKRYQIHRRHNGLHEHNGSRTHRRSHCSDRRESHR